MADESIINLSLDRLNVESTCTSIVREYLARKVTFFSFSTCTEVDNCAREYPVVNFHGYKETLKTLDTECPRDEKSLNSRTKIIDYLKLNKLYDANKKLKEPYSAVLEVVMSYCVVNDIVNKPHSSTVNVRAIQVQEKKMGNNSSNDIHVDDAEDGELTDGTEKRLKNAEKEAVEVNKKRIPITNSTKKSLVKEPAKKEEKLFRDDLADDLFGTLKPTAAPSTSKETSVNTDNNEELDDFDKMLKEKAKRIQRDKSPPREETSVPQVVVKKPEAVHFEAKPKADVPVVSGNTAVPLVSKNTSNTLNSTIGAIKKDYQTIPMDYQSAVALKTLIFGNPNIVFNDEWKYQSFAFCDYVKLKYGLVQKKGGPCGVLASVQAYILQELFFPTEGTAPASAFDVNKRERSKILAVAIAKLLWKCGRGTNEAFVCVPSNKAHFAPVGKYRSDGITETINLLQFNTYKHLEDYLLKNVSIYENEENYGVILLLYAAIFSRTIKSIHEDMDEPTSKLMGQHFYCTQEMVNLLIHGKAYSNVFNDVVYVDKLKLRGPDSRNDIGLLSLFEHYKSCEVGSYYKTPKYPIWVICSESHFSIMFSTKRELLSDWKAEHKFDLYYYDGLSRQDEQIKLTIDCSSRTAMFPKTRRPQKGELVPPLELVVQTKWKDAIIDWNGYEPIL